MTTAMTDGAEAAPAPHKRDDTQRPGEEELRFVRNFHDVFISIGIGFFAIGLLVVSTLVVGGGLSFSNFGDVSGAGWSYAAAMGLNAGVMWLLAEFFARSRRQFLPSIVILLAFAGFVSLAVASAYGGFVAGPSLSEFSDAGDRLRFMPLAVTSASTLAIFVYYLRTKLPFAMGFGALGLTIAATAALGGLAPDALEIGEGAILFFAGVFLFVLGLYFDARDPQRVGRLSDNAFWLHLFAAPLIFFSVRGFVGAGIGGSAPITLILVGVFAVISLLINRRALLVSGLLSALWATGQIVQASGLNGAWTAGVTLLILGAAMVALGGGWRALRRMVVAPFPKTGFIARIIPPDTADG